MRVSFFVACLIFLVILLVLTKICLKYVDGLNIRSVLCLGVYVFMLVNFLIFIHVLVYGDTIITEKQGTNLYEVKSVKERVINTTGFSISKSRCMEKEVDNINYPILEENMYIGYKKYLFFEIEVFTNNYILKIPKDSR